MWVAVADHFRLLPSIIRQWIGLAKKQADLKKQLAILTDCEPLSSRTRFRRKGEILLVFVGADAVGKAIIRMPKR